MLQIVHGMVEYIERYEPFAAYLNKSGIAVIGHDQLGHGYTAKEEKDLGFFCEKDGDRAVIFDIHQVTTYAKKTVSKCTIFSNGT